MPDTPNDPTLSPQLAERLRNIELLLFKITSCFEPESTSQHAENNGPNFHLTRAKLKAEIDWAETVSAELPEIVRDAIHPVAKLVRDSHIVCYSLPDVGLFWAQHLQDVHKSRLSLCVALNLCDEKKRDPYPRLAPADNTSKAEVGLFLKKALSPILAEGEDVVTTASSDTATLSATNTKQGEGNGGKSKRFRVALSFPGERREFLAEVANSLARRLGRERVFYDKYYEAELARLDLDTYLQEIYHDDSDLIAVFLCADYEEKEWCGLEWRAIRDLIKKRDRAAIMPFRFDNTSILGLFSIDGYVEVGQRSPNEVASLILQRLEPNAQ